MRHHENAVTEPAQIHLSIGLRSCAGLRARIAGFQGVALPSWIQARPLLISNGSPDRIVSTNTDDALREMVTERCAGQWNRRALPRGSGESRAKRSATGPAGP